VRSVVRLYLGPLPVEAGSSLDPRPVESYREGPKPEEDSIQTRATGPAPRRSRT
jgi:hypothetical protein